MSSIVASIPNKHMDIQLSCFAGIKSMSRLALVTIFALTLLIGQCRESSALSLISEKCDPSKVGPEETTVKGGWQAEIFNGLAFRACDKNCTPDKNRDAIVGCFKAHSPRAFNFYQQCTRNATILCGEQSKQEIHYCLASLSQAFVHQEKCGQILSEATIKCLSPHLTDQIELCFIKENVNRITTAASGSHVVGVPSSNSTIPGQLEVVVQSPKPARAFLKQFEYANYDSLRHECDPELEFDNHITGPEMTEIQAFYTIASTLCRDECVPDSSKKQIRDCVLKNSPQAAKVFQQCTNQWGSVCNASNEESLTTCFNAAAQNLTYNERCVELISDETQKCWSTLIKNETTHCVERKQLQLVSFEYGKACNASQFSKRPREEQTQIMMAHKTNQENLLRRSLEIMCFPNCVGPSERTQIIKCFEKDSPAALQIYNNCSKSSKLKCDMEENIESYAEYVNCIYLEAENFAKVQTSNKTNQSQSGQCANLVSPSTFRCLESLYPNEIFHCPDVKIFHEAQAEAALHHNAATSVEEYDYENN